MTWDICFIVVKQVEMQAPLEMYVSTTAKTELILSLLSQLLMVVADFLNDYFDLDFVLHEVGHQFGATHTYAYDPNLLVFHQSQEVVQLLCHMQDLFLEKICSAIVIPIFIIIVYKILNLTQTMFLVIQLLILQIKNLL